ncbi:MAG: hypothetical protein AAF487_03695 [Bacteroidota bacterium]
MELHTFSSLTSNFLKEYEGTMDEADKAIVYFSPEVVAHKKLEPISNDEIRIAFDRADIEVVNDTERMQDVLLNLNMENSNLLLMSSGNFGGIKIDEFSKRISANVDSKL